MNIRPIGIDLGKTTFHLVALGERGKVIARKKLSRKQLLAFTANLEPAVIGLEACSVSTPTGLSLTTISALSAVQGTLLLTGGFRNNNPLNTRSSQVIAGSLASSRTPPGPS